MGASSLSYGFERLILAVPLTAYAMQMVMTVCRPVTKSMTMRMGEARSHQQVDIVENRLGGVGGRDPAGLQYDAAVGYVLDNVEIVRRREHVLIVAGGADRGRDEIGDAAGRQAVGVRKARKSRVDFAADDQMIGQAVIIAALCAGKEAAGFLKESSGCAMPNEPAAPAPDQFESPHAQPKCPPT